MGWGHGFNSEGREVGYSVQAVCDQEGCSAVIDRGMAYCCGGMHDGGEYGCGGYFCADHLHFASPEGQVCSECAKKFCPMCGSADPETRLPAMAWSEGGKPIMVPCDDAWHLVA